MHCVSDDGEYLPKRQTSPDYTSHTAVSEWMNMKRHHRNFHSTNKTSFESKNDIWRNDTNACLETTISWHILPSPHCPAYCIYNAYMWTQEKQNSAHMTGDNKKRIFKA